MSLKTQLTSWDQKSKHDILEIYKSHAASAGLVDKCLKLLHDIPAQRGATWLLKHHIETSRHTTLTASQTHALLASARHQKHWESQLHILQLLPRLTFPEELKGEIRAFLDQCLEAENKFVRAWAYSGRADLAAAWPEFLSETETLLETATEHEHAGSIRARLRKAQQTLQKANKHKDQ